MKPLRAAAVLASSVLTTVALAPAFGGEIVGKVKYAGNPPAPARISITKDQAVCSKVPHLEESLLVGADKGVRNVVVRKC